MSDVLNSPAAEAPADEAPAAPSPARRRRVPLALLMTLGAMLCGVVSALAFARPAGEPLPTATPYATYPPPSGGGPLSAQRFNWQTPVYTVSGSSYLPGGITVRIVGERWDGYSNTYYYTVRPLDGRMSYSIPYYFLSTVPQSPVMTASPVTVYEDMPVWVLDDVGALRRYEQAIISKIVLDDEGDVAYVEVYSTSDNRRTANVRLNQIAVQ